jgi:hypothetical protein
MSRSMTHLLFYIQEFRDIFTALFPVYSSFTGSGRVEAS